MSGNEVIQKQEAQISPKAELVFTAWQEALQLHPNTCAVNFPVASIELIEPSKQIAAEDLIAPNSPIFTKKKDQVFLSEPAKNPLEERCSQMELLIEHYYPDNNSTLKKVFTGSSDLNFLDKTLEDLRQTPKKQEADLPKTEQGYYFLASASDALFPLEAEDFHSDYQIFDPTLGIYRPCRSILGPNLEINEQEKIKLFAFAIPEAASIPETIKTILDLIKNAQKTLKSKHAFLFHARLAQRNDNGIPLYGEGINIDSLASSAKNIIDPLDETPISWKTILTNALLSFTKKEIDKTPGVDIISDILRSLPPERSYSETYNPESARKDLTVAYKDEKEAFIFNLPITVKILWKLIQHPDFHFAAYQGLIFVEFIPIK